MQRVMLAIGDDHFEAHQPSREQENTRLEVHILKALGEPMLAIHQLRQES
jgi:hypothetical protein